MHFLQLTEKQYLELEAELDARSDLGERQLHLDGPLEEGWQVFEVWSHEASYLAHLTMVRQVFDQKGWVLKLGTWSWPVREWISANTALPQ